MEATPGPLLQVEDLKVSFATEDGIVKAVDGVTFSVDSGEVVAIVGESGSGKSVSAMTLMGLTRGPNAQISGRATIDGTELISASEAKLQQIRGGTIAMVFQDPMSSLNPVYRIGTQIVEQIRAHDSGISKAAAMDRAVEMMERVGIPRAQERLRSYPHEFSGGMRQRVMIAMALSCSPKLLIADEPTTALDVTIQAQILDLMRELKQKIDAAIVLITHDLGVVAEMAQRVVVMYAGRKAEEAPVGRLFRRPLHPYTKGLLASVPRLGASLDHDRPPRLAEIAGTVPSLKEPIPGCPFEARCTFATEICRREMPAFDEKEPGHFAACFHSDRVAAA
jgi:peptide/nickel transport system ATP-binding protein